MKRTAITFYSMFFCLSVRAQQWVMDEIAEEGEHDEYSFGSLIIVAVIFGLIYLVVYLIKDAIESKKINEEFEKRKMEKIKAKELSAKKAKEELYRKRQKYIKPCPVDLGLKLPILWSDVNIGATIENPYGECFSWASIKSSPKNSRNNQLTDTMSFENLQKLFSNNKGNFSGLNSYDAATAIFGSLWRTPTEDETKSLIEECKWESIIINSIEYYKITGPNGNYILLPANPDHAVGGWTITDYWTATPSLQNNCAGSQNDSICDSQILNIIGTRGNQTNNTKATMHVRIEAQVRSKAVFVKTCDG